MNPTPEALALAAGITGHWQNFCLGAKPIRLDIAQLIDEQLQLPQCKAALAAAQSACDIAQRGFDPYAVGKAIDELRDALAQIKTK